MRYRPKRFEFKDWLDVNIYTCKSGNDSELPPKKSKSWEGGAQSWKSEKHIPTQDHGFKARTL